MKNNIVNYVADALCTDPSCKAETVSYVMTEIAAGHARKLYEQLQERYSEADTWEEMMPISNAMNYLWKTVEAEIMAENGITEIETCSRYIHMKTLSFWYEGYTFYVDIVMDTDEDTYEAYLYTDGYSIKEMMFGCLINGTRFGQETTETLDSFTSTVIGNLPDYVPGYMEQYMD